VPVIIVVPETASKRARELMAREGAEVIIQGKSLSEANAFALSLVQPEDAFLHPFDDPLIWTGHASIIDEVVDTGPKPDVIVLSVGGGGLLCGVIEGLNRNEWQDVPIIAVETRGADSFAQALSAGALVELPRISRHWNIREDIALRASYYRTSSPSLRACNSCTIIMRWLSPLAA
jgi:L-serine/L-threonine ammonia-lyase